MSLPIWDPIDLPPDYTLVDVNSLTPEPFLLEMQARALSAYVEDSGESYDDFQARDWSNDEGIFAVYDSDDEIVGVALILDVEDA